MWTPNPTHIWSIPPAYHGCTWLLTNAKPAITASDGWYLVHFCKRLLVLVNLANSAILALTVTQTLHSWVIDIFFVDVFFQSCNFTDFSAVYKCTKSIILREDFLQENQKLLWYCIPMYMSYKGNLWIISEDLTFPVSVCLAQVLYVFCRCCDPIIIFLVKM